MPNGISLMPVEVNELYPSWIYYEAQPGETINTSFFVWNGYEEIAEITLGALDSQEEATLEDFQIKTTEDEQVEIGEWAQIPIIATTIESRTSEEIPLQIVIPEDAELDTYLGAVYANYVSETSLDSPYKMVLQNGLRVIINVTDSPREVNAVGTNLWTLPQLSLTYFSVSVIITLGGFLSLLLVYRSTQS